MNNILKFGIVLIINTLFFVLCAVLIPIHFETNDDVVMLLIASGKYSGTPDAHLVFINYIYGFFVSFLYTFFEGLEWYSIMFSILHIISFTIITWEIINKCKRIAYKIVFIILFYSIAAYIILHFQFTTTAGICAVAGIALLMSANKYKRYIGLFMFVVASLIRFDAAMLVLVVSCPVLYYPIHLKQKEGKLRNELLFLSLIVILPVVCKVTDHVIYKADKDWAHYKEYNYYRGKVNDNPSLNTIKGGHPNLIDVDYDLFDRFFIDENFWDLTTVKGMYEEIGELGIEKKIPHVYPNFDGYRIYILLLFLFLLGQIYLARRSSDKIILSLSFCLFLSALFYVSFTNLLKERVFLTALIGLFWVLFSAGGDVKKLKIEYFTYSFFIVFLFFFIQKMVVTRSNIDKLDLMDQNTLLNNVEIPEGEFLITYYDGLKLEKYSPYEISDKVGDTKILFSGWMAGTPFNREYFTSYKDIIDRNMIFIRNSNDLPQWSRKLKKSIKVHYGTEVEILVVYETSNCKIIKLISSDKNN